MSPEGAIHASPGHRPGVSAELAQCLRPEGAGKSMPQSLSKYIHLVFSTKQREPLLLRPLRGRIHAYLATVLKNLDSPARRIVGMSDHVHMLFRMSKNHALADVVEAVKTSSSKWVARTPVLGVRGSSLGKAADLTKTESCAALAEPLGSGGGGRIHRPSGGAPSNLKFPGGVSEVFADVRD